MTSSIMDLEGVYQAPPGNLSYTLQHGRLIQLSWSFDKDTITASDNSIDPVKKALDSYFNTAIQISDIPFDCSAGTPFQQRVWCAICAIPIGEVCSYGALAQQLNTSSRAVGQACKKNPIALLIPCHRVIATDGLGGYMGRQFHIKQWLLDHESRHKGCNS